MDKTRVNEGSIPIASDLFPISLFILSRHASRTLLTTKSFSLHTRLILYSDHGTLAFYFIAVSKLLPELMIVNPECVCQTS
jgi:hypothetical protein